MKRDTVIHAPSKLYGTLEGSQNHRTKEKQRQIREVPTFMYGEPAAPTGGQGGPPEEGSRGAETWSKRKRSQADGRGKGGWQREGHQEGVSLARAGREEADCHQMTMVVLRTN